jgi:hypothetical protein
MQTPTTRVPYQTSSAVDKAVDLAIQAFFDACPIGYYVEYIIPVGGRKISGLHVLANLQYLPIISK